MRDLSRDDDFLSHLLVEKLGTGAAPLVVHKMDAGRTIPKANPDSLMQIVRTLVTAKGPPQAAIRVAVDELLTHASRYFELYLPTGSIEIAHTSRYSHKTGKSELCILATRPLNTGTVITELKGSMADLTDEEDMELKRIDATCVDGVQIRRDFSVIHSKQLKKNHLFLGPARFVNHDCDHNVELFREGRYITFRVIKPIGVGEEVTAHYGDGYFGRDNRHCLCETCEKLGRGGYATDAEDDEASDSGPGSPLQPRGRRAAPSVDSDSDSEEEEAVVVNVNARSTRRGVYAVVKDKERIKGKGKEKAAASELVEGAEIELEAEVEQDISSDLTSLPPSRSSAPVPPSKGNGLMTPEPDPQLQEWLRGVGAEGASVPSTPTKGGMRGASTSTSVLSTPTSFRSVIATRAQKAKKAATAEDDVAEDELPDASVSVSVSARGSGRGRGRRGRGRGFRGRGRGGRSRADMDQPRQLETPPLTAESASVSVATSIRSSSRIRSRGGDVTNLSRLTTPVPVSSSLSRAVEPTGRKDKGKERASEESESESVSEDGEDEPEPEPEMRTLRPRASLHGHLLAAHGLEHPVMERAEAPRGEDGKLLPTCITCRNVLPVIHVEGKPVWGLVLGRTGKRGRPKKNIEAECPRCLRHSEIYGLKWPERRPGDRSSAFLPTPRETRNSTPITHSALAALDRKLAFAKHGYAMPKRPYKRRREVEETEDGPPAKRAKPIDKPAATSTGRPRGRPPKHRVGMSTKAKQLLKVDTLKVIPKASPIKAKAAPVAKASASTNSGRRSGRTRVPSIKLRESVPPRLRSQSRAAHSASRPPTSSSTSASGSSSSLSGPETESVVGSLMEPPSTPVKRKREGEGEEDSPKVMTPKSLAVAAQPRESNGRFGKKSHTNGRFKRNNSALSGAGRRSRQQRALMRLRRLTKKNISTPRCDNEVHPGSEGSSSDLVTSGTSDEASSPSRKRPIEDEGEDEDMAELSAKRIRIGEDLEDLDLDAVSDGDQDEEEDDAMGDSEPEYMFRPALFSSRGNSGAGLLCAPNPMSFARRKWSVTPIVSQNSVDGGQSSTDDNDTDLPPTPEDDQDAPVVNAEELAEQLECAEDEDGDSEHTMSVSYSRPILSAPALGGKLLKPSPHNLARRRWAPPPPPKVQEERANGLLNRFGDLEYPYTSDEEDNDIRGPAEGLLELARSPKSPILAARSSRASTISDLSAPAALLELSRTPKPTGPSSNSRGISLGSTGSTGSSELVVEQLVSMSPSPRPASLGSPWSGSPRSIGGTPTIQQSPSLPWKQISIREADIPYLKDRSRSFSANLHSSPVTFERARWCDPSSESDSS
ncbi:hypothetical protein IEO21_02318 [Rhodonia placenta]|uniref:SET domain-containing protein n=1 Tax=Rhodonia placenta TaxID=104341 RepID=A0A8H7U505_9APHY|nr:hypothetical protein IEO21_02318 [Postia placenta]